MVLNKDSGVIPLWGLQPKTITQSGSRIIEISNSPDSAISAAFWIFLPKFSVIQYWSQTRWNLLSWVVQNRPRTKDHSTLEVQGLPFGWCFSVTPKNNYQLHYLKHYNIDNETVYLTCHLFSTTRVWFDAWRAKTVREFWRLQPNHSGFCRSWEVQIGQTIVFQTDWDTELQRPWR